MSFFSGAVFFGALTAIALIALVNGILEKSFKWLILTSSAVIITAVLCRDMSQLVYFIIYIVIEMAIIKGYEWLRKKYGRSTWCYRTFVLLAILPLVLSKLCDLKVMSDMDWFRFAGISYLTFRVVQMIIEIYDGVIKEVRLDEFISFLAFFPTFSCGPIDRSRRFSEDYNHRYTRSEYLEMYGTGLQKIVMGLLYKFVLAAVFFKLMTAAADATGPAVQNPFLHFMVTVGYAYSYGVYMFFDFAGYSLMAIGTGYMLGIKVPENFRKPFISRDMKEFWDRWHISLSYWFRDFVFSRFVMLSIKKKWFKKKLTAASVGFIVNMTIMGCWHGLTVHYILYGVYHGVLLAATEIYQKKSGFHKKHKKEKWYMCLSWFVTLNLVMFGFLIFSGHWIKI